MWFYNPFRVISTRIVWAVDSGHHRKPDGADSCGILGVVLSCCCQQAFCIGDPIRPVMSCNHHPRQQKTQILSPYTAVCDPNTEERVKSTAARVFPDPWLIICCPFETISREGKTLRFMVSDINVPKLQSRMMISTWRPSMRWLLQ